MKVLLTDGNSGQTHGALSAARALAVAGHEVHVTVSRSLSTASWSRHSQRRIPVPTADRPDFAVAVRRLVETEPYDLVLPASDTALLQLGLPSAVLVDKGHLHARAASAGVDTPRQLSFDSGGELIRRAAELRWPVAVKSAAKSTQKSIPAFRADGPADLEALAEFPGPVVVEEWLSGEQRAVAGVIWQGRVRALVHQRYVRTWPRQCGVGAFAVTTEPVEELEEGLEELLQGHEGLFQCQYIGGRLHDVNPRVYGSLSLAVRAGVNLPDLVCRLASGDGVGLSTPLRARPGVGYRWVEGDLRHAYDAWQAGDMTAGSALRLLRPRRGTAHPDLWLSDPGPSVARLLYAARAGRATR